MTDNTIQLDYQKRIVVGKQVKKLRSQGKTPVVIYTHGKESIIAQVNSKELLTIVKKAGKHHPVILTKDNQNITAMIKETVLESKNQSLSHVVFNSIFDNQMVEAEIPVKPKYTEGNESSPAERAGLIVIVHLESVLVEALANNLPDKINYDAEKLVNNSDHILVSDLEIPKNVTLLSDLTQSVASVYEPGAVEAANNALSGSDEEIKQTTVADTETSSSDNTDK